MTQIPVIRIGVDEYLLHSADYMRQAMSGELVVIGRDGEIAMIVAGRVEPLDRREVTLEEFRADPAEVSRQALHREVRIVVDADTSVLVRRRLDPLV